jgi:formylglycine-generating enzyme required for sulfatase activity
MNDPLRQRIDELQHDITHLESVRKYIGDAAVDAQIAPLERERAALLKQIDPAALPSVSSPLVEGIAARSLTIHGDVQARVVIMGDNNSVFQTLSMEDAADLCLRGYYHALAGECSNLPLGVIDVRLTPASLQQDRLRLPEVYIDLDVSAVQHEKGEDPRQWGMRMARGEGEGRTPLLAATGDPDLPRVVLLGDAGSGKTSFVNYLTYRMARGFLGESWPDLPAPLAGVLPLRVVLRKAARQVAPDAKCGTANMIFATLRAEMNDLIGADAAQYAMLGLRQRLAGGKVLVLLDGLDEVPEAGRRRDCLIEAVRAFLASLPKSPRVILTARPYAYGTNPQWQLSAFKVLTLAPFDWPQVERFVRRWYQAARPVFHWDDLEGEARTRGLLDVLQERDYLSDLASRPILLTLIAALNASQKRLPEDRADLYEQSVQLLLTQWQRQSVTEGPDGRPLVDYGISRVLGLDERDLRKAMAHLAYTVHNRQGRENGAGTVAADIPLGQMLEILGEITPPDLNSRVLVEYLDRRSGLLIAREKGVYAFPHRSFQEYLAGVYLADQFDFHQRIRALAESELTWWREVILLAIGRTRQGGEGAALSAVAALIPGDPDDVAPIQDRHWRLATLAGLALLELRLVERAAGDEGALILRKRAQRWLVKLVEEGHLPPRERAEAGDVLGQLGDPRFDSGGLALPVKFRGAPEELAGFVPVEAGPFCMGWRKGDPDVDSDEYGNPPTLEMPYPYWIGRYPVTVGQYAVFIEADGYQQPEVWSPIGWSWRNGQYDSKVTDRWLKDLLPNRPPELRGEPWKWKGQKAFANHPVTGVSWFEAMAYVNWLDIQLRADHGFTLPPDYRIRLATEAEWEKAARGGDQRRYPWGDTDWDEEKANFSASEIGHPTAVGLYPQGAAPGLIFDLSGNVWDWTLSIKQPYPYLAQSRRGTEDESAPRTLRGGSWAFSRRGAHCAYRIRLGPGSFGSDFGFRVVLSLAFSEF